MGFDNRMNKRTWSKRTGCSEEGNSGGEMNPEPDESEEEPAEGNNEDRVLAADSVNSSNNTRVNRMKEIRMRTEKERRKKELRKEGIEEDDTGGLRTVGGNKVVRSTEVDKNEIQDFSAPPVVVGSDVTALYPNLEDQSVAQLCHDAVMQTKIEFYNVDYGEAVKYIAMNSKEEDCRTSDLRRVLPIRRGRTGTRPGVTGEDPLGRERGGQDQWRMPRVKLTDLEKRKIVAAVIRIGVVAMFNTHVYTFAGKYFVQQQGGPIGLRSTCAVARITMLDWDNKWQRRMEDNNIEMEDGSRYMDDVRGDL